MPHDAVQLHDEMNATYDAIKLDKTDDSSDHLMNLFKRIDYLSRRTGRRRLTSSSAPSSSS